MSLDKKKTSKANSNYACQLKKYQKIQMINDKYIADGIKKNDIGYILEIYDENYCEVEFSDNNGFTIAMQAICKDDFVIIDNSGQ